jgi:hypothetical protein
VLQIPHVVNIKDIYAFWEQLFTLFKRLAKASVIMSGLHFLKTIIGDNHGKT